MMRYLQYTYLLQFLVFVRFYKDTKGLVKMKVMSYQYVLILQ